MTENCGLLTCLGPEEHRKGGDPLSSAGRPVPGSVVSIQDESGKILGPERSVRSAPRRATTCASTGTVRRRTAAAFAGGWYHTGDAGRLDNEGYLYLVDRVKDMIVTGGENVYSAEVENALASHPSVEQVAVIGIPSEAWGEAVHAIVVLKVWDDRDGRRAQGVV